MEALSDRSDWAGMAGRGSSPCPRSSSRLENSNHPRDDPSAETPTFVLAPARQEVAHRRRLSSMRQFVRSRLGALIVSIFVGQYFSHEAALVTANARTLLNARRS